MVGTDGGIMQGTFENFQLHPRGTIIYQNGDYYEGELSLGLRHGKGEFIEFATLARYVGGFQN